MPSFSAALETRPWAQSVALAWLWTPARGQRSLGGQAIGAPFSQRDKCGEEEARHREVGSGRQRRRTERCTESLGT